MCIPKLLVLYPANYCQSGLARRGAAWDRLHEGVPSLSLSSLVVTITALVLPTVYSVRWVTLTTRLCHSSNNRDSYHWSETVPIIAEDKVVFRVGAYTSYTD